MSEQIDLREAAEERYLGYALSVITSRALPDVRDGLKPVQRRILYAMYQNLRLAPGSRPRKSASTWPILRHRRAPRRRTLKTILIKLTFRSLVCLFSFDSTSD